MSSPGLVVRRLIAASLAAVGAMGHIREDSSLRILQGPQVSHGRVLLPGARTMWRARRVIGRTGHKAIELWLRGAAVAYILDDHGEVSVEFDNGLVLMAAVRPAGGGLRLVPLRRELAALELLLVPVRRS